MLSNHIYFKANSLLMQNTYFAFLEPFIPPWRSELPCDVLFTQLEKRNFFIKCLLVINYLVLFLIWKYVCFCLPQNFELTIFYFLALKGIGLFSFILLNLWWEVSRFLNHLMFSPYVWFSAISLMMFLDVIFFAFITAWALLSFLNLKIHVF